MKSAQPKSKKKILFIILRIILILFLVLILAVGGFLHHIRFSLSGWNSEPTDVSPSFNVVYKTVGERDLHIDIYYPTRRIFTESPVAFYYHGGSWNSGSKNIKDENELKMLLEYGITIVGVEYRLTDETTKYPAFLDDCADAIRFMAKNAKKYKVDTRRFCAFGASAGGQISLMMTMAGNSYGSDKALSDTKVKIKCGIALCAPTDFENLDTYTNENDRLLANELLQNLFGGTIEELPSAYKDASPMNHINKNAPPIFLSHGKKDDIVPFGQAESFYNKAKEAKMDVRFYPVENANHKFKAPDGGLTSPTIDEVLKEMTSFIIKELII